MATFAVETSTSYAPSFSPVLVPFAAPEIKDVSSISDSTVFLKVRFGVLGNAKKVSGSEVLTTDADQALLKVSKTLLDSQELAEVKRKDMNMRKWLEGVCLPYDIGISLLPIGLIENVHAKLEGYKVEREELVNAFIAAYPVLCAKAAQQLGSLFNHGDYPSVDDIKARFAFSWDYISFGVPGALKGISPSLFAAQKEKAAQQLEEAASEITLLMRQSLHEMVSHLADRLAPGDEGKPKILRESAVSNLKEFLATFDFRNITNDTQLAEQVAKARSLIDGTSVESLRKSDTWRASIQEGMQRISDNLEGLIEEKTGRKFRED